MQIRCPTLCRGELLQFPRVREPRAAPTNQIPEGATAEDTAGGSKWPVGCDAPACERLVTPAVLAARYKLPSAADPIHRMGVNGRVNGKRVKGNSMAVAEFQGQYYKESDLANFGLSCHVRDVSLSANPIPAMSIFQT